MEESFDVDALIDGLIEREGGYVNHPADKGGPTCFGITEAVARAHGYAGAMRNLPRSEAAAIYRRLYWLRPRFDQVAETVGADRGGTVRHGRQHGAGGRDDLPSARPDRAQPQCQGLCRFDARMDASVRSRCMRSTRSSPRAASAAGRPFSCVPSRRSRASDTFASLSGGQPTRHSYTAGSRTASAQSARRQPRTSV